MSDLVADLIIFIFGGHLAYALLSFFIGRFCLRKNPLRPSGLITNTRLFLKTWLFTIIISVCLLQLKFNLAMNSSQQESLMEVTLPIALSSFFTYKLIQLHIKKRTLKGLGVKPIVVASEDSTPQP